jgi:hypothetical protein
MMFDGLMGDGLIVGCGDRPPFSPSLISPSSLQDARINADTSNTVEMRPPSVNGIIAETP